MNQMNRQQLFNLINTVSFAVDDLLLFLDTHPEENMLRIPVSLSESICTGER
jgi:hypothetical protein